MENETAKALKILQDELKEMARVMLEVAMQADGHEANIKELKQGAKDLEHRVAQLEKRKSRSRQIWLDLFTAQSAATPTQRATPPSRAATPGPTPGHPEAR